MIFQEQELDLDALKTLFKNDVSRSTNMMIDSFINMYEGNLSNFWNDARLTPQEKMDAYGNQAYLLFVESNKMIEFIKTYRPEYQLSVTLPSLTINENGTVTIIVEE